MKSDLLLIVISYFLLRTIRIVSTYSIQHQNNQPQLKALPNPRPISTQNQFGSDSHSNRFNIADTYEGVEMNLDSNIFYPDGNQLNNYRPQRINFGEINWGSSNFENNPWTFVPGAVDPSGSDTTRISNPRKKYTLRINTFDDSDNPLVAIVYDNEDNKNLNIDVKMNNSDKIIDIFESK